MEIEWAKINRFEAYVGGYFGKSFLLKIERGAAFVDYQVFAHADPSLLLDIERVDPVQLNDERWHVLIEGLKLCGFSEWDDRYELHAMDGTGWHVKLDLIDGRKVKKIGSNAFPAQWQAFCGLMSLISNQVFE